MAYKKITLLGLLIFLGGSGCSIKGKTKEEQLRKVKVVFGRIQGSPLPPEWKMWLKTVEPEILNWVGSQIDMSDEREKCYLAEKKTREESQKKIEEYRLLMEQLNKEIQSMGQWSSLRVSLRVSSCGYYKGDEREECQQLAKYTQAYFQYSQACHLRERIQSLRKQIEENQKKENEKKSSWSFGLFQANDKQDGDQNNGEVLDFLQREQTKALEQLKLIPDHDKSKNGQSYYDSLTEEEKKKLNFVIETVIKHENIVNNYAKDFTTIHNVFKKK